MIVNEIKAKVMVFGNRKKSKLQFNPVEIDDVNDYKYLSNVFTSVRPPKQNRRKKGVHFCVTKQIKPHSAWQAKSKL